MERQCEINESHWNVNGESMSSRWAVPGSSHWEVNGKSTECQWLFNGGINGRSMGCGVNGGSMRGQWGVNGESMGSQCGSMEGH